jgi:hypothetical protein
MASATVFASSMVLYLPYEIRMVDLACFGDSPSASRTWEDSYVPELQAELVSSFVLGVFEFFFHIFARKIGIKK